jgi:hypothetical protein
LQIGDEAAANKALAAGAEINYEATKKFIKVSDSLFL